MRLANKLVVIVSNSVCAAFQQELSGVAESKGKPRRAHLIVVALLRRPLVLFLGFFPKALRNLVLDQTHIALVQKTNFHRLLESC